MIRLEDFSAPEDGDARITEARREIAFSYTSEITETALSDHYRMWLTAFTDAGFEDFLATRYAAVPADRRHELRSSLAVRKRACADEAHFSALFLYGDSASGIAIPNPTNVAIPDRAPDRISRNDGSLCWVLQHDEYLPKKAIEE